MKMLKKLAWCLCAMVGAMTANAQITMQSPTGNTLPGSVSVVGGIVLDLIGSNNNRVVSQLAASQLFVGFYDDGTPVGYRGNPGTIGVQTGFSPAVIAALGGGIQQASIRFTLFDGDTASGDFDFNDNSLLLNGIAFGNWSTVNTITHDSTGTSFGSQSGGGFRDGTLDTGFFYNNNVATLASLYTSLVSTEQITYQISDIDAFDNFFDFTQGVDGGLINIGTPPVITPPTGAVPEPSTYGLIGAVGLIGLIALRRRSAKRAIAA